nr:MAG TPA: hypothetical protein [Caudoviricetes sp.]
MHFLSASSIITISRTSHATTYNIVYTTFLPFFCLLRHRKFLYWHLINIIHN